MRNKYDNLLLAILWLTASTLGVSFWFNTQFGFNIFSSAHWHHLAHMQAVQQPIKPLFYISTVAAVVIVIVGLYLLIRPRLRKIQIPIHDPTPRPQTLSPIAAPQPVATPVPATAPAPAPSTPIPLTRPPRLSISVPPVLPSAQTHPQSGSASPAAVPAQSDPWLEIKQIFESTGYTVLKSPRIGTLQTSLLAIGTDETVWIGAVGYSTDKLGSAIDIMRQIFLDTLDDIEITINGFIIAAPDATSPSDVNILTFDSMGSLRNYMNEHQNPPLSDDKTEDFDAFKEYITTVIKYIEQA